MALPSTNTEMQDARDAIVPEPFSVVEQLGQETCGGQANMMHIKAGAPSAEGPHKCVPTNYMAISCPVVRALAGSGWLQYDTSSAAGQYLTNANELLNAMTDVLGFEKKDKDDFVDNPIKPFQGILGATRCNDNEQKQVNNGKIDLLDMEFFLNHAASSGILGSATHECGGEVREDAEFNNARFTKLTNKAGGNDFFTPQQFGRAVNKFARARYKAAKNSKRKGKRVDLQWSENPYSWAILTLEYSNTLAAFKNQHFVGGTKGNPEDISKAAVTDLWKNGHLPNGFVPAKDATANGVHFPPITVAVLKSAVVDMDIKIPKGLISDMRQNDDERLNGPRRLTRRLCGGDADGNGGGWPACSKR